MKQIYSLQKRTELFKTCTTPLEPLPQEVLSKILSELDLASLSAKRQRSLLTLASINRSWREAATRRAYSELELDTPSSLVLLARTFKKSPHLTTLVQTLSISVPSLYALGDKKSTTWKGRSIESILQSCTSTSSLALSLGPSHLNSLSYLSKGLSTTFSSLPLLTSFIFTTSEIWIHDLATLFSHCPSLVYLELGHVRGDVSRPLSPRNGVPSLHQLEISSNTLAPLHLLWLLENQTSLDSLRIDLPGPDESIFALLTLLAPSLLSLHLGPSYPPLPNPYITSPLLPLLLRAQALEELSLLEFMQPHQLEEVFEIPFGKLEKLWIDDGRNSGMRVALKGVLEDGEMGALREVVSVGMRKMDGASSAGGKAFAKACERVGVKWTQEGE